MPMSIRAIKIATLVLVVMLCQACTLAIPVDDPELSTLAYSDEHSSEKVQLRFMSSLPASHASSVGRLSINLTDGGSPFDAATFMKENLQQELDARGVPVEFDVLSLRTIDLKHYEIYNRRISGFSPLVTVTTARMDLQTDSGTQKLVSVVKMAKVPVWTMDEVNEPCFNQPVELVVKEITAKINRSIGQGSLTDNEVAALVTSINRRANEETLAYLDVYELGFSNNDTAIPSLLELTKHDSDYVRLAAISSLGILKAESTYPTLKSIYETARLWQDRGMALKAMGDLGTPESLAFLASERPKFSGKPGDEALWNDRIIGLYLDN